MTEVQCKLSNMQYVDADMSYAIRKQFEVSITGKKSMVIHWCFLWAGTMAKHTTAAWHMQVSEGYYMSTLKTCQWTEDLRCYDRGQIIALMLASGQPFSKRIELLTCTGQGSALRWAFSVDWLRHQGFKGILKCLVVSCWVRLIIRHNTKRQGLAQHIWYAQGYTDCLPNSK